MALYEYDCSVCGKHFQVQMTIADYSRGDKPKCPHCDSLDVRRILSPPNIFSGPLKRSGGGGCCGGGRCG